MKEFKGTPGPWVANPIYGWIESDIEDKVVIGGDQPPTREDVRLIAAAPELLEALQWALPMAILAMEQHRMERVKNGHRDISGTYKNGESWVGIYQDEVDKIEFARAAIAKALGESQ